ncbi:MAG: hypothetical protein QT02_C0003G0045 [archaeon GW2011_AR9]|nr:MAG: hypothetical protein QT02_C0003G0045 [archaeon GW2011_AR9]MBS3120970.1 hypothetical protein [Candidatus Woesearchaeota archaeon]HIG93346.1 hypothetical protein [Candidatus Woesearchaeota archaeon]HIH13573.1 hypothetical protein [Candidatus Woesearchaeota archaeon]
MEIHPFELEQRIRQFEIAGSSPYSQSIILADLNGLEQCAGKRVLEIGGSDEENLAGFFLSIGAIYETVRIERNLNGLSYVHPTRNYLYLPSNSPYDLVISLGVFEEGSIDRDLNGNDHRTIYDTPQKYLEKLLALTKVNGFNIIGTISSPCMFSLEELSLVGFDVTSKITPFYSLSKNGYPPWDRESELVVMRRLT